MSSNLTVEQQNAVIGLAQLFLSCDRTGQIINLETHKIQSSTDYVNEVLKICGIKAEVRDPPSKRDVKTLQVTDEQGQVLEGKVSKDLECATRRHPEKPVGATKFGGWWKPNTSSSTKVLVKEK